MPLVWNSASGALLFASFSDHSFCPLGAAAELYAAVCCCPSCLGAAREQRPDKLEIVHRAALVLVKDLDDLLRHGIGQRHAQRREAVPQLLLGQQAAAVGVDEAEGVKDGVAAAGGGVRPPGHSIDPHKVDCSRQRLNLPDGLGLEILLHLLVCARDIRQPHEALHVEECEELHHLEVLTPPPVHNAEEALAVNVHLVIQPVCLLQSEAQPQRRLLQLRTRHLAVLVPVHVVEHNQGLATARLVGGHGVRVAACRGRSAKCRRRAWCVGGDAAVPPADLPSLLPVLMEATAAVSSLRTGAPAEVEGRAASDKPADAPSTPEAPDAAA
eukprot:CAMPEP_0202891980 /NCGR_PEP_ID=MMETSP1392-20130828/1867_1 /ASSEMBLY_ACC=CAM_ASM_000868 /TAXON_ID=225041 /ORGANISM="Chlamydomonas chlamydogama, Strain SAG 11-48b" /LENGTH=326 /DNA_ID=CAMNT_0049575855 /DNA_START=685 /DNA_END=1666 /DNA_ORIENTATION=+